MQYKDVEEWRPINGYEGLYEVSSHGNVKSVQREVPHAICGMKTINEKILKKILGDKYYSVKLSKGGVIAIGFIHVLVARAFHSNPENKKCVNHKNGDKLDNYYTNLEWATYSENNKHAFEIGVRCNKGDQNAQSKLTTNQVVEIKLELSNGYKRGMYKKLGKLYGVGYAVISEINRKKSWTHVSI